MAVSATGNALQLFPICGNRPRRHDRQPPLGFFHGSVNVTGDASGGAVTLTWLPEGQTSTPVGGNAAKYIYLIADFMAMISPAPAATVQWWMQVAANLDPSYPTTGFYHYAAASIVSASAQASQVWSAARILCGDTPLLIIPDVRWPLGWINFFGTNTDGSFYEVRVRGWLWDKKAVLEDGLGLEWPLALRRGYSEV